MPLHFFAAKKIDGVSLIVRATLKANVLSRILSACDFRRLLRRSHLVVEVFGLLGGAIWLTSDEGQNPVSRFRFYSPR